MIAFFVVMGVIFTALLLAWGTCSVIAWFADHFDDAIWISLGRGEHSRLSTRSHAASIGPKEKP